MTNWYAIQTRANAERTTFNRLVEVRKEQRLQFEVWFPRQRVRVAGGQWDEKPAWPRYLFLSVPNALMWLAYRCKFSWVRLGEHPTPIPDEIMRVLMAGADDTGLLASKAEVKRARFQAMQRVRYIDGPLRDALLRVIEDDGGDTIRVLMTIFGSERATTARAADLEAA
jgi:transcription antitermination factor NusG